MSDFLKDIAPISIITGHYGSGKTNFAVNLAIALKEQGKAVTVIDLDIVNPYFRTADFEALFASHEIDLVIPPFANTNLDIPALSGEVDALLTQTDRHVILDVGGDDAGAIALGRYARLLQNQCYRCYYILNAYRYLTKEPEEAVALMKEIEAVSRITVTDLVNNSNLGKETSLEDVLQTNTFADEVASQTKLPLACTCIPTQTNLQNPAYFAVKNYIKSI